MCVEGDGGRCRTNGVTYKITCKGCEESYIGETSQNAYTRGLQHMSSVNGNTDYTTPGAGGKPKSKPTLKHHVDEKHPTEHPLKFRMEVTGVYGGDALLRQVSEAVQIRSTPRQMNRQEEWRQVRLPRLRLL